MKGHDPQAATLVALLRGPSRGMSVRDIADATGWSASAIRGNLTSLLRTSRPHGEAAVIPVPDSAPVRYQLTDEGRGRARIRARGREFRKQAATPSGPAAAKPTSGRTPGASTTREFTEYRIESLRPGTRKWEFIRATGAGPTTDRAQAEKSLARITASSAAGWTYRIASRDVTTVTTSTGWQAL
jgi:hypothetical protein